MEKITKLRDETKHLLITRPANLSKKTIASEIDVSIRWLERFANGDIDNPSVVTIETLNVFLTKAHKRVKNV